MRLIVGLGNPGFRYRATRHNIGFMALDKIASRSRIKIKDRIFGALCGRGSVGGREALLMKPLTYMNLAGSAVARAVERKRLPLEDLLVITDDADLDLGRIRLRTGGSSGGHRGLRSVIEELGTEEFARLRAGIGPRPDREEVFLSDFVLSPFGRGERGRLKESIESCCACAETWARDGAEAAMRIFNS